MKKFVLFLVALLLSFSSESAELEGYTHFYVKNKVIVDIPYGWTIRNDQEINRIKELGNALSGTLNQNVTNLAADCFYNNTYYMSTRVSFRQRNDYYSEETFEQALRSYGDYLFKETADEMKVSFSKANERNNFFRFDINSIKSVLGTLNNKKTLAIQYNRTVPNLPNHIVFVEQNHVFTGYEDIIVTFSYDVGCSYCKSVISDIKNSVRFVEK